MKQDKNMLHDFPFSLVLLRALSAAEARGSFSSTCAVAFLPVTAVTMRKRRTIKVTQSVAILLRQFESSSEMLSSKQ